MGQWQSKFSDGDSFLGFWLSNVPITWTSRFLTAGISGMILMCAGSAVFWGLQMHSTGLPQMSTIPFLLVGKTRCRVQCYTKSQETSEAVMLITIFKNNWKWKWANPPDLQVFAIVEGLGELFSRLLCLNTWFPAGGGVWGGWWTFKNLGMAGQSMSLEGGMGVWGGCEGVWRGWVFMGDELIGYCWLCFQPSPFLWSLIWDNATSHTASFIDVELK